MQRRRLGGFEVSAGCLGCATMAPFYDEPDTAAAIETLQRQPKHVAECCEKCLKRLQTEIIDTYYIHRIDPTVPIEDMLGAMSELGSYL
jgi:aryl-alcohol dehydrogenase-like predicted oxidoreductase